MPKILKKILAGICGLFLAKNLLEDKIKVTIILGKSGILGIKFTQEWQMILFLGIVLGLINYYLKPILNFLSFPLKILSLGLFSILLNMFLVWLLDFLFVELEINGLKNLFLTTLIVWASDAIIGK
ncbi:phage holin family protein [Candidatus Parcubacteria bacterium]|nr:phage holin family protein [Candidatus Parcubacteria bacterium]